MLQFSCIMLIVAIIVIVVVCGHVIERCVPGLMVSPHVALFIVVFLLSFWLLGSQNIYVPMLVALIALYSQIVYGYSTAHKTSVSTDTAALALLLIASVFISTSASGMDITIIKYAIFFLIAYLVASIVEWCLHKYVMHAYIFMPWVESANIPFVTHACVSHKYHHCHTKDDMTLSGFKDQYELILSWTTLIAVSMFIIGILFVINNVLQLDIPLWVYVVFALIAVLVHGFVWNAIHPRLHDKVLNYSFAEGAPQTGLVVPAIYIDNHVQHHLRKGPEKGNFNVVFLGADEIFRSNRL